MRCTPRASNGPNHLGLCALQVERTQATLELMEQKFEDAKAEERAVKILSGALALSLRPSASE